MQEMLPIKVYCVIVRTVEIKATSGLHPGETLSKWQCPDQPLIKNTAHIYTHSLGCEGTPKTLHGAKNKQEVELGLQCGSVGKGTCHHAWGPESHPQDSQRERREWIVATCSLTPTKNRGMCLCACKHTQPYTHSHTHTYIQINKQNKF